MARVLLPVTLTMIHLRAAARPRESERRERSGIRDRDAASATDSAADDEISEEEGRELLQSIVDFTETVARGDDTAARHRRRAGRYLSGRSARLFREEQYSRMPVYRDSLDNILGIVYVKDMVALPPDAAPPLTTLMRSAYFVPESKRASELLKEMQRRQLQMASSSTNTAALPDW